MTEAPEAPEDYEETPQEKAKKAAKIEKAKDKLRGGPLMYDVSPDTINAMTRPELKRLAPREEQMEMRSLVRGGYKLQHIRVTAGNRIVAAIKSCMGVQPGVTENHDEMSKEDKTLLEKALKSHERMTDGLVYFPTADRFQGDEIISKYATLVLVEQYKKLLEQEKVNESLILKLLPLYPLWGAFLKGTLGCGTLLSGFIISEVDIRKAMYVSSLWKFCGIDVPEDGRGRSKRLEHQITVEYVDKDGNIKEKNSLTHKPATKSKIVETLMCSFMRQARVWSPEQLDIIAGMSDEEFAVWRKDKVNNKAKGPWKSPYAQIYDDYKHRIRSRAGEPVKPMHLERMAKRYAAKMFLKDLYNAWRPLEGLTVHDPYAEAKLGIKHSG